ncbi:MAG: ribonuclease III, partial [Clostridia bacterium]|nr:ribonuclease III [Clostridia bacterium]
AGAQARAMQKIAPMLTEQEAAVFRRGRNMGHGNVPKGATVAEYRNATGMEVLAGYLHLSGEQERLDELLGAAFTFENTDT